MPDAPLKSSEPLVDDPSTSEAPRSLVLHLTVADPDSIAELITRSAGRDRDEYVLCALRIGLLSLKHARGQIDADVVRHEGDKLLQEIRHTLEHYRSTLNDELTASLKEYFDPNSGRFQERIERLIKEDGDLEQLLRRQLGADGSELANTLATHVGEHSPLMRLLDPGESDGLIQVLRKSVETLLEEERNRVLQEFSLDNKEGALSRLIHELEDQSGRLKGELADKIDEVVNEFSLDKEDSALSRLVRRVEKAQQAITQEFSLDNQESALSRMSHLLGEATDAINSNLTLDNEQSALARLRRELLAVLKTHEEQASTFQTEVKTALEAMKVKREEALRSTTHGKVFEDVVVEFLQKDAQKSGDIAVATGNTTGTIKYCKIGDAVVELGPEHVAAGERFVVEAKEDTSYDLEKARTEIEQGRKNRDASVGVFVFSTRIAPASQHPLLRLGQDIFVVWDAEDVASDVVLGAALSMARALCVRHAKGRKAESVDFQSLDEALISIETEAKRLSQMKTWTETIQSNSGKVLDEIRKMSDNLEDQLEVLRKSTANLKEAVRREE